MLIGFLQFALPALGTLALAQRMHRLPRGQNSYSYATESQQAFIWTNAGDSEGDSKGLEPRRISGHLHPVNWVLPILMAAICSAQTADVPSQESAPLPSPNSVIDRVLARTDKESEEAIQFKRRFAYCRTRTTERRNSKGELLSREISKDQHVPGSGPGQNPDSKQDTGSKSKRPKQGGRGVSVDRELLSRFMFTVAGRDKIENRSTLILDFVPVGNGPERNLMDRFINRIAGRVWIDETDAATTRISFHLTAKVNFVAGLAGSIRAFSFDSHRERTADGLWFTRDSRWHLDAREVIVNRLLDQHEELTDVQLVAASLSK
jgi:hypothetical protein